MLGDLMIFSGVPVGLTPLLDLLMSDTQKIRLSNAILSFWNWVDDRRAGIRARLSRRPTIKQILKSLVGCLVFVIFGMLLMMFGEMLLLEDHIAMTILGYIICALGVLLMLIGILPIYVLWYVVVMVIVLFVISPIVGMLELVVRRIAEYPKGPVFAISVVCGALGALFEGSHIREAKVA